MVPDMLAKKLLSYYQNELSYLRKYGKRFARHFPKVARRLGMSDGLSEDPHVERIIESFALITAQIQQRLDEDMPEVTEALLTVLAPQFLRPYPSVCIVQMQPDRKVSGLTTGCEVAAGMTLFTRNTGEHVCRFRTLYPVMMEPLTLEEASLRFDNDTLRWQLELRLQVWPGAILSASSLRFYLNGSSLAVNILYTLLNDEIDAFSLVCGERHYSLSASDIQAVGFNRAESILECDPRISPVYALLQDYFYFPQKFHFIDFSLPAGLTVTSHDALQFTLHFRQCAMTGKLDKIASTVDRHFFRLHCTPAVNLYPMRAEPIIPHDDSAEYPVVPDIRRGDATGVWSVNRVCAMHKTGNEISTRNIAPLFGLAHSACGGENDTFWQCMQRETVDENGSSTRLFIAFSDRSERPLMPESDMINMELTCYDRDTPSTLRNGDPEGDFESELAVAGVSITALTRPTRSVPQPVKQASRWRLISHLSLNHMLISGDNGVQVLKETLALYNINNNPVIQQLINLIKHAAVTPVTARLISNDPQSMARGVEIRMTFHSAACEEPEYFLFCRFIEHFLSLYAPVNSFSRVVTCIEFHEQSSRMWPVRSGRLAWI